MSDQMQQQLAATPPMGWNSWNQVRCEGLTERVVLEAATALVDRGLAAAGYRYVVVDDCWQGGRDESGRLVSDPVRFPSGIPDLAARVHELGLRFGIYAVPGAQTCANYYDDYPDLDLGSYGRERLDAETFAGWGVDYLKYDWCRAEQTTPYTRPEAFALMHDELARLRRPIVYAISEYGEGEPWRWAPPIANLWRTTADIAPEWPSIVSIIEQQAALAEFARPGAWNDPDMLQFGNGALTLAQNRSHFAMWCMLAAPLFLGTNVASLAEELIEVLTNADLVAIDQDPLGRQARRVATGDAGQVWVRELAGGDFAVALFNQTAESTHISASFDLLGVPVHATVVARDVWAGSLQQLHEASVSVEVAAFDTRVFRLSLGG
ncbi:glycoside hydrolase family 27 protein [Agromyces sp. NPDC058126]|uniref:glycoside hydrolase family 27 protein n=1 Tax=Agromyces sp. NPDC058126 TaxID=3346350 RepID=UPI0036D9C498